jgi:cytochrome c oxidase subunit II
MKRMIASVVLLSVCMVGCQGKMGQKDPVRIKVVAKKYGFEPAEIRVKKGDEVLLEVTTADVQHGFHIADLDISEPIQKGKVAKIRFSAANRGEHKIECDIICGPRHDEMVGKLIIE